MSDRITILERAANGGRSQGIAEILQQQFRVVPTCPPSTTVRVMAGTMHRNAWVTGYQVYDVAVPSNQIDFSDPEASEISIDASFNNALWYKGFVLAYGATYIRNRNVDPSYGPSGNYTYKFYSFGGTAEYSTAAEAEAEIDAMLNGTQSFTPQTRFKLCGVVLRNDGTTGANGAVQQVEALNRGRSYLYRDARLQTPIT